MTDLFADDDVQGNLEAEFGPIGARLRAPAHSIDLGGFAEAIEAMAVTFRLSGLAPFIADPALPGRMRGAFGEALAAGASDAALAGRPCDFEPPSAFEALFRKQGRMTPGSDFPSPWLIALDSDRGDLIVRLTLFGMTTQWVSAAAEAFAIALRRTEWTVTSGRFLPRWHILGRTLAPVVPEAHAIPGDGAEGFVIETLSPVVLHGAGALDRPASLFTTLAQRIEGLARWQEATIDADWSALACMLNALSWRWSEASEINWIRGSRRQGRAVPMAGVTGRLTVSGDPEALVAVAPLFRLAGLVHIGADVAFGCGRVVVRAL